jgi:hypothetical protein
MLTYLSKGYTLNQIANKMHLSIETVQKYSHELADEAKKFIDESIKGGTSQILKLTLANVTDVIYKADQMMENTMDERTKLMCMKIILESAKLRNETVMSGFNHVALKESNDMLEKVNRMSQDGPTEAQTTNVPNFRPEIVVNEAPERRKVDVEGVLPKKEDRDEVEEPQEEEKPIEVTTKTSKLKKQLNLSRHVTTNAFNRMETEEILK